MPDGPLLLRTDPTTRDAGPTVAGQSERQIPYAPPLALILEGLNTTEPQLHGDDVTVDRRFLMFLLCEMARQMSFDAEFYADAYPDAVAMLLAGDVSSLHDHFVTQGYLERRQPRELSFSADYYASQYEDLARAFGPRDKMALLRHFTRHGWQEGRVATGDHRAEADRWVAAARAGAQRLDASKAAPG